MDNPEATRRRQHSMDPTKSRILLTRDGRFICYENI